MLLQIVPEQWAVTVNISPNKFINKKPWKNYSAERQTSILERILTQLTTKNPSIALLEYRFEVCPIITQIHVHALFECAREWVTTIENWIHHSCEWKDDKSSPRWRHLQIDPIFSKEGWIKYINKDQIYQ